VGLFTQAHEDAVLACLGQRPSRSDAVIQTLADVTAADPSGLSWEQILLLRNNGFLQAFRQKIAEWANVYARHQNPAVFRTSIDQLVKDAMFEIVGATEPDVPMMVLSAAVGILPGVSALASAKTLIDTGTELQRRRSYGWLYFVQKVRAQSQVDD
jgi:hypothetical protein